MMDSDSVHGKTPTITTVIDDDGQLKIMSNAGEQPPQKPITPVRSYSGTKVSSLSDDEDSSDKLISNDNEIKPVDTAKTVSNVFSFGKLSSALPLPYLGYFTSKPSALPASVGVLETESNLKIDIEGGIIDETDDKSIVPVSNTRTWSEWASEKSIGKELPEYLTMLHEPSTVEIDVPARSMCRAPFLVPKGSAIIWTVRVRLLDLGFAVRLRRQGLGGAVEDDIEPMRRITAGETVLGGRSAVDYTRHIVFVFDNTYSKLRAKKCAHRVQVGPHLTCDDESVLAAPDVMASPFVDPVAGPSGAQGQLAVLSAILGRAKESYSAVMDKAKLAGEASLGAVHGGMVVAAGAPMLFQRAIVASLRRAPAGGTVQDVEGEAVTTGEGEVAVAVAGVPMSQLSDAALLPVLDMDNFCALWVQLEEGSAEITSTVIPRPVIEDGFPLQSFPQHLSTIGGMHVLASGDVTGGCQIFGYSTTSTGVAPPTTTSDKSEAEVVPAETLSYYVLIELTVSWRGPSQESPGYDDWLLKVSLRTPCPDKTVLKTAVDSLKLSDVLFITV